MNNNACPNREQLLHWIDMISFALIDTALYLDTHPDCPEGLSFYKKHAAIRKQAMDEYARHFGPLTLDQAGGCQDHWSWIHQPWPWEGGKC